MSALAAYPPEGYTARLLIPMTLASLPTVLAQAASGSGSMNILFFGALFAIMYFVLIRPQQKQAKEQQTMIAALKKGDDVITSSGILGKVFAVDEKVITVEIARDVKVRMLKTSVQGKVTVEPRTEKSEGSEAKKEEK
ncbi:MAG: preprotein translocase subunit YajC [Archangium sp.]|nr:preprotein translocase subunit YajC [Archangium sp.]